MHNEKKLYIAAGVFIGVGLLFFSSQLKNHSQEKKVTFRQLEDRRREAILKGRMERDRVEHQNFRSAPTLSEGYRPVENKLNNDASLNFEASQNHATADSAEERSGIPTNGLESQTNQLLAKRQEYEMMNKAQKKRFIEDYKRQARAAGYLVELDDNTLKPIRVQRIPAAQKSQSSEPIDVDQMEEDSDESAED